MNDIIKTFKKGKTFNKQQAIDPVTGELSDILLIGAPEEFDKDFVKVFHAFTEALLQNEDIAGKAIRLLFWIMKQLDNGSIEFYLYPPEVAKELKVTRMTIYNWIKTLKKYGIIKKVKPNIYMINPACVVKGKGHRLLDEFKKEINNE